MRAAVLDPRKQRGAAGDERPSGFGDKRRVPRAEDPGRRILDGREETLQRLDGLAGIVHGETAPDIEPVDVETRVPADLPGELDILHVGVGVEALRAWMERQRELEPQVMRQPEQACRVGGLCAELG